ncbi:type IV pilus modification protein PilV [Kaarinaea lacus]
MKNIRLTSLRCLKDQRGFTLIEVLIAIVVLAIGLLGLAGLQASSLKNNTSAYTRSQAQLLAYDMLDRLRANREGVKNGAYDNLLGTTPTDPSCITSGCSVAALAQHDAFEWSALLNNTLPSGVGRVVGNGAGSVFTITVMWDDERTGATGLSCGGDAAVDLTCFKMSSAL